MDFFSQFGKQAAGFGIGLIGSWFTGAVQKNQTKIPNDTIPQNNAMLFGGGVGTISQDMEMGLSAMAGAVAASAIKSIGGKLLGKLFGGGS